MVVDLFHSDNSFIKSPLMQNFNSHISLTYPFPTCGMVSGFGQSFTDNNYEVLPNPGIVAIQNRPQTNRTNTSKSGSFESLEGHLESH